MLTDLTKIITSMSGRNSAYKIFTDWIECAALSTANAASIFHGRVWNDREENYKSIMSRYTKKEQEKLVEMFNILLAELEENPRDVLGELFMKGGMGEAAGGQFFTPYHVSKMMAELAVLQPEQDGIVKMSEPSCGSGGGIIAAAMTLGERGDDYQKKMRVVAQDLDLRCVYMCYVQLSYLGIDAVVVQGNTLSEAYMKGYPENKVFRTPRNTGALI